MAQVWERLKARPRLFQAPFDDIQIRRLSRQARMPRVSFSVCSDSNSRRRRS